jgi:hypothetical protein
MVTVGNMTFFGTSPAVKIRASGGMAKCDVFGLRLYQNLCSGPLRAAIAYQRRQDVEPPTCRSGCPFNIG